MRSRTIKVKLTPEEFDYLDLIKRSTHSPTYAEALRWTMKYVGFMQLSARDTLDVLKRVQKVMEAIRHAKA